MKKMKIVTVTLPILFACFLFCGKTSLAKRTEPVKSFYKSKRDDSGKQYAQTRIPSFNVFDVNGETVNLQQLRGKILFVNLWASWCPPCRQEIPSIEKLAAATDSSKVMFLMISLDDNFAAAKRFARNRKLSLPIYYPAESLPPLFQVQGIPATFIFNKAGVLIKQIEGSENFNTDEYKKLLF